MAIASPNKPRRTSNMTNINDRLLRMELMILARQEKFPIHKLPRVSSKLGRFIISPTKAW